MFLASLYSHQHPVSQGFPEGKHLLRPCQSQLTSHHCCLYAFGSNPKPPQSPLAPLVARNRETRHDSTSPTHHSLLQVPGCFACPFVPWRTRHSVKSPLFLGTTSEFAHVHSRTVTWSHPLMAQSRVLLGTPHCTDEPTVSWIRRAPHGSLSRTPKLKSRSQ